MSNAPAAWARRQRKTRAERGNGAVEPPADARIDLNGGGHGVEPEPRRFTLTPFDAIKVSGGRNYLVKELIPREGVIVVWGPPKCGKTFWTLDLVMHIAAGWEEYRGRRVEPGSVVYVACEGERGIAARVEAFRRAKMAESEGTVRFSLVSTRLDLVDDYVALIEDIRAQLPDGACSALVIDTLNRSIRGSESDDAVMGAYARAADALRAAFGCAVIIIHHCGVDLSRPRGHTSLTGAADAQIAVRRDKSGRVATEVEWMKDGPEGAKTLSTLPTIEVGKDEDGEPITSCYIEPRDDEEEERARKRPALPPKAKVALDLLSKAIAESGEPAPASNTIPRDARVVKVDQWRRYAYAGSVSDSDEPAARRQAFSRAVEKLQAIEAVGVWQGYAWLRGG